MFHYTLYTVINSVSTLIISDYQGRCSNLGFDLVDTADAIDITKARFPGTRFADIQEDVFQRGTLTAPLRKATFSQINKLLKVLFLGFDLACWELGRAFLLQVRTWTRKMINVRSNYDERSRMEY